jgi:hypothetical protein
MLVDSNSRWIGLTSDQAVALRHLHRDKKLSGAAWHNAARISPILASDFTYVIGLYSRHGRFYPPFTPHSLRCEARHSWHGCQSRQLGYQFVHCSELWLLNRRFERWLLRIEMNPRTVRKRKEGGIDILLPFLFLFPALLNDCKRRIHTPKWTSL